MVAHDVIVIGASAGGVEALIRMVSQLPDTLAASLFVVTHFPVQSNSLLPQILNRYGHLQATHYECHVGHTYSFDSLMAGHTEMVEETLWSAARALEERASLIRQLLAVSPLSSPPADLRSTEKRRGASAQS